VDVNILGPIEIRDPDGRAIALPSGRERSLLALLLIHRDEVVSTDRIVDALWGAHPPETAMKAVQGYVSHLRRVLEFSGEPGAAHSGLVTQPPGYALRTDGIRFDAGRFERLAADGRRALEDDAPAEAADLLDEALALWRGPALAEFAFDDFARNESDRLEQLRLSALEDRNESLLRLGRHGELAGQLESLVAAHPLRERLRGQWMLALYRGGRQAEALQAYRDGRRLLAGELGLEPGPELQRLERAILAQEPALDAAAPPQAGAQEAETPPPRSRRRRVAPGILLVLVGSGVLAAVLVLAGGGPPASVRVVAPAVVAVDAKTNRVVASIPVGPAPVAIASGEGAIWVGDARDGTVRKVDPRTRRVAQPIGIGAPAIDLATGLGNVWVATGGFGAIVRIDPELGAMTGTFDLGAPGDVVVPTATAVGVGDGRLWAGAFDGMVRLDPSSGDILHKVDLGGSPALKISARNGAVWATLLTRRAARVAAGSGQETTSFHTGTALLPMALSSSALWLAGAQLGELWRLDPISGSPDLTLRAGHGSSGVAVGAGAVWVTSWKDRALYRIDPESGDLLATIRISGEPEDVVVRNGLVWIAVQDTPAAR
jgi:DNA-binding SARP family transcriptional activator/streptogramin lyase